MTLSLPAIVRRAALLPALATMFFVASANAQELDAAQRGELLKKLETFKASHPTLQADFIEERTSRLLKAPVASKGTIAFQTPNKFRRELTGTSPSLTISNGKELWIYYPNFKEAELYTLGTRAMFDDAMAALTAGLNFGKVESFYNLHVAKTTDGGYLITLTPKKSNLKRIVKELVIDMAPDFAVRKTDFLMPKGDRVITRYENTRYPNLQAATFDFTPPADANISRPLGK